MLDKKRIDKGLWWQRAWSLISGCTPVSSSCRQCWLKTIAHRFHRTDPDNLTDRFGNWTGIVKCREDRLDIPLKRKKPTVWAIWSDLFHHSVSFDFILRAFAVMKKTEQHTFLVLTKRPERALEFCAHWGLIPDPLTGLTGSGETIPDNVFWGTTVENQRHADERIPLLLQLPGKKFLSVEPMLESLCLGGFNGEKYYPWLDSRARKVNVDAVIIGCESGSNARPMNLEWAEDVVDQCKQANVPVFIKQIRIGDKIVKDITKFPKGLQVRDLPW